MRGRTDMDNKPNKYICGIDYAASKDMTVGINFNSKKFNGDLAMRIKEIIEEHKKNIGDYIQCSYE